MVCPVDFLECFPLIVRRVFQVQSVNILVLDSSLRAQQFDHVAHGIRRGLLAYRIIGLPIESFPNSILELRPKGG